MGASELVALLLDALNEEGRAVGLLGRFTDIREDAVGSVVTYRGFAIPVAVGATMQDITDEAMEIDRA